MPNLSRRHLVTTAAALPALAVPAAAQAMPAFAADQNKVINEMWERRLSVVRELAGVHRQIDDAEVQLPKWARCGPRYLCHDGTFDGPMVGWPLIEDDGKRPTVGDRFNRRPGPHDLRDDLELTLRLVGNKGRKAAQRAHAELMAELNARIGKQRAEQEKFGLPTLYDRGDELAARISAIEDEVVNVPIASPAKAAAMFLLGMSRDSIDSDTIYDGFGMAVDGVLPLLHPFLSGALACHVADVMDNPDIPMGQREFR
jgi:hypothetical protein